MTAPLKERRACVDFSAAPLLPTAALLSFQDRYRVPASRPFGQLSRNTTYFIKQFLYRTLTVPFLHRVTFMSSAVASGDSHPLTVAAYTVPVSAAAYKP